MAAEMERPKACSRSARAMSDLGNWSLQRRRIGHRVLLLKQTDSTNNRAAELAADHCNDGAVILAREQTSGRGQHGRTWTAPAGSSVLLSVLLFPPPELRRPALLTGWAAVSV